MIRERSSLFHDFVAEFLGPFMLLLGGLLAACAMFGVALYMATSPATCHSYGRKMQITVDWGFWTGCMIDVRGQWLPWTEVVPIERNGKIVFEPKPVVRLQAPK